MFDPETFQWDDKEALRVAKEEAKEAEKQAFEKGYARGLKLARQEMALNMLKLGISFDFVKKYTKLTLNQIIKIAKENHLAEKSVKDMESLNRYIESVFRSIFTTKIYFLRLYQALTNYCVSPKKLQIHTVSSSSRYSDNNQTDIFFFMDDNVGILRESENAWNPNTSLQMFFNIADIYQRNLTKRQLYSTMRVKLPSPYFYAFYHGEPDEPFFQKRYLAQDFFQGYDNLNLCVYTYNLACKKENWLLKSCPELLAYETFAEQLRDKRLKDIVFEEAAVQSADYCIEHNLLKEYFEQYKQRVSDCFR